MDTTYNTKQRERSADYGTGRKGHVRHHHAEGQSDLLLSNDFNDILLDESEEVPFRHSNL